jgi:hypothetical protein
MQTMDEVKSFLDELVLREKSSILTQGYRLNRNGLTEDDCQSIEHRLNIQISSSLRSLMMKYDWSNLAIGGLSFHGTAKEMFEINTFYSPFQKVYREMGLLQIGENEADPICAFVKKYKGFQEGEVVQIYHDEFLKTRETEFVASNFETLIFCLATNLKMKKDVGYSRSKYPEESRTQLFNNIFEEILKIEPRANESSFWEGVIEGR